MTTVNYVNGHIDTQRQVVILIYDLSSSSVFRASRSADSVTQLRFFFLSCKQMKSALCLDCDCTYLLISEDDKNATEDGHEIDEEIDGMPDVVRVATTTFLDDQLRVVEDETTRHCETDPQDRPVDDRAAREDRRD